VGHYRVGYEIPHSNRNPDKKHVANNAPDTPICQDTPGQVFSANVRKPHLLHVDTSRLQSNSPLDNGIAMFSAFGKWISGGLLQRRDECQAGY